MISPTVASQHHFPAIPPIEVGPSRGVPCENSSSFLRQLTVLPEILSTLDTLTTAGQHYVMSKVLAFILDQAGRACRGLSASNQRMFVELIEHLTYESERLSPDTRRFSHRAESMVALLGVIA
jgi:hypothetical protein